MNYHLSRAIHTVVLKHSNLLEPVPALQAHHKRSENLRNFIHPDRFKGVSALDETACSISNVFYNSILNIHVLLFKKYYFQFAVAFDHWLIGLRD